MVKSAIAFIVSTVLVGCMGSSGKSPSPEQARKLVDELYAAWSLHEPDRVDAILTDNAIYEDVTSGQIRRGKNEIKDLIREASAFAPDFRATLVSFTFTGDTATTEWIIEGTQSGAAQIGSTGELPATERSFRVRGASILRFQDGRIAQVRDYYDMATFLRQLGVTIELPTP